MGRYGINAEGVEALNQLARNLFINANEILEANTKLNDSIVEYSDELGIYGELILDITQVNILSLNNARLDIEFLASEILKKADQVRGLLCLFDETDIKINAENTQNIFNNSKDGAVDHAYKGLQQTKQGTEELFLDGKRVTVFDHPFSGENNTICNQGSGFPSGPQQTCGCCACGSIMNKTGLNFDERKVVDYAWQNKLCGEDGSTQLDGLIKIISGLSGTPSSNTTGQKLETLASEVEKGKGVIIAVLGLNYHPSKGWLTNPFASMGHALVLDSVIRDASTGEILEYIVVDSNGRDRSDACRRVPKDVLEKAYNRMQYQSLTTDDIIW
ncbi:hypothetical protein [Fusibacter bizertensis]